MSETSPSYQSVPQPSADLTALLNTCLALKANVESLTRQRGTTNVWAATVQEVGNTANSGNLVSASYLLGLVDQASMLVASVGQSLNVKLNRSGDVMSGQLTLPGNGTDPKHAATIGDLARIGATGWNEITDKPVAFPPKPHHHPILDIDELQPELDRRALLDHTHIWTALQAPTGSIPIAGQVLGWDGTTITLRTLPAFGGGSGGLSIGPAPPITPQLTPFWFDTISGALFLYFSDGDSSQWVAASPTVPGPPGVAGTSMLSGPRMPLLSDGRLGDFWINNLEWVVYGPKDELGWPVGTTMRRGGNIVLLGGERMQLSGFNVELS